MTFKTKRVGDVIAEIAMGPFGSNIKVDCFVPSGVPVLNGSNLTGFSLTENTFNYVTTEKAASLKKAIASRGDIVITHRGTLGQIVYIPANSNYEKYVISQSQFRVRCKESAMLPEFMVYFFHTRDGRHKLLSNSSQVGVPALARPSTTFQELEIPVPTITEQRVIVATLSALDARIALNKKINHHLEQMAQAIFKSWFVDFEPFDGEMPSDWREGTISDLGNVIGGSTPSKAKPEYYTEHGIAWITPKDLSVNKNKFIARGADDITELGLRNSSAKLMPRGTVLFSSRAPIGYIAIASGAVCTNQGFKSIIPNGSVGTAFIYYFLIEKLQTIESMASGSTFKEVSGTTMKGIPAIIPDDDTLRRFQEECIPIFEKQELLEKENSHLAEIRDALLPRLMSGDLSVAEI